MGQVGSFWYIEYIAIWYFIYTVTYFQSLCQPPLFFFFYLLSLFKKKSICCFKSCSPSFSFLNILPAGTAVSDSVYCYMVSTKGSSFLNDSCKWAFQQKMSLDVGCCTKIWWCKDIWAKAERRFKADFFLLNSFCSPTHIHAQFLSSAS